MEQFDRLKGDRIRSWKAVLKELDQYSNEALAVVTANFTLSRSNNRFNETLQQQETREPCRINTLFQDQTLIDLTSTLIEKQSAPVYKEAAPDTDAHHCRCRLIGIPILDSNYDVFEIFFAFREIRLSNKETTKKRGQPFLTTPTAACIFALP